MKYIELFAGCGGLSLGLESIGCELVLANELSPMAGETFAYNHLSENLENESNKSQKKKKELKTKWLSSNFDRNQLSKRLREDPRTFPKFGSGFCDFESAKDLKGNLLIADITSINKWLDKSPEDLKQLKTAFGDGGIDLISGGPPCQSFSMAGMREFSNNRNILPWEFAKFVNKIKPKFALLENVTGILRPFKVGNKKHYAWFEVAKAFAKVGYVPLCLHINAKYCGVAQNRPRFILIAIRSDVYDDLEITLNSSERDLFKSSSNFYNKLAEGSKVEYGVLDCFDVSKPNDLKLFENSFLKELVSNKNNLVSVKDAIDDLRPSKNVSSEYLKKLNTVFNSRIRKIKNHDFRKNSDHVKRRFNIYQIMNQCTKKAFNEVKSVLKGDTDLLSDETSKELLNFTYLYYGQELRQFSQKELLEDYLISHRTKKQTQKALKSELPAPAALSIPDDACHYHPSEIRTLTVREMARIQSFPDNFVFRSKVTTGGKMRRFEVPQYTQVGNAVPPLLGRALGLCIKELSQRVQTEDTEYPLEENCKIECPVLKTA